jgi:uncharacterized protein involved in exopolysaccharide biosynthesis
MEPYRPQYSATVEAEPQPLEVTPHVRPAKRDQLIDLIRLLWMESRFLCRMVAIAVFLAVVACLLLPNRYTSVTRLMPPEPQSTAGMAIMAALSGGSGRSSAPAIPGGLADLLGTKTSGDLFIAVLRSDTVQNALINRFDLRKVYWDRYYDTARKDLARFTDITEDRKSGVIKIEVTDRNRERAARLAQAYVEELDRAVAQLSTSAARRERIFLEERLKTAKHELDDDERRFSEFASKNATLDVPEQTKAMVTSAALLQGQIIAAKSELQALEQTYTPQNIRVRSLRERIAELERQQKRLGGTAGSQVSEGNDQGSADDIYPAIRQLPILAVPWADLYREVKVHETVYQLLTQQYELARVQEAKEIPTVRVLDPPELAERKSSPQRTVIVLIAGLLSCLLASAWVIAEYKWQRFDPGSPTKQLIQEISAGLRFKLERLRPQGPRSNEDAPTDLG